MSPFQSSLEVTFYGELFLFSHHEASHANSVRSSKTRIHCQKQLVELLCSIELLGNCVFHISDRLKIWIFKDLFQQIHVLFIK